MGRPAHRLWPSASMENISDLDNSWQFVAAFGSEAARKQMEQGWKISILRIPTSADAFVVTRADMDFFERLLGS